MNTKPYRLLIVVLLLGWAFDYLIWEQPVGINFAIFAALCTLAGFLLLLSNGLRPARKSLPLLAPFAFFAVISFIRQEPLTLVIAHVFTIVPMSLLAFTYLGGRWPQYGLLDYVDKTFQLVGSLVARPLIFFFQVRKEQVERNEVKRMVPLKPVVRGLAIALPVVILFTSLLSSADMVFSRKLTVFYYQHLFSIDVSENLLRLIIILISAYGLAGAFLHTATASKDEKLIGEGQPVIKRSLGFTEAAIVLGSVAILFLAFVIIQAQYFFGGQMNIGEMSFTYSEYARRGFNELVTVALLSLLLTLGFSTVCNRETEFQRRTYSGLSVAILVMVLVILLSAYERLGMAMDWHGFSRLRLYPRLFMIWLGLLFVAVVVLEIIRRERYFAFAAVVAALGFAVTLSLLNVDAFIARHNVWRAAQGFHFNVNYLSSLSTDAVPALVDEYHNTKLPITVREGVGAALQCYMRADAIARESARGWQSQNLSQQQSSRALDEVRSDLQGYSVNVEAPIVRVGTPNNEWYECATGPLN